MMISTSYQPLLPANRLLGKPAARSRHQHALRFGHVASSESAKKTVLGGIVGTLFGGLWKDIHLLLKGQDDVAGAGVAPSSTHTPVVGTAPGVAQDFDAKKQTQACLDVPTPKAAKPSRHTHQVAYAGPVVTAHGAAQNTVLVVGQVPRLSESALQAKGIHIESGQTAVEVTPNLMKNIAKANNHPALQTTGKTPYQKIKDACFDLPDGSHTHHAVWQSTPLEVTVDKKGKKIQKSQPMVLLVGQAVANIPNSVAVNSAGGERMIQLAADALNPDVESGH